MKKIDINIGDKFGILTVIEDAGRDGHRNRLYKCRCECGKEVIRRATHLVLNEKRKCISSCGCRKL